MTLMGTRAATAIGAPARYGPGKKKWMIVGRQVLVIAKRRMAPMPMRNGAMKDRFNPEPSFGAETIGIPAIKRLLAPHPGSVKKKAATSKPLALR
jgi:hypothetical protein